MNSRKILLVAALAALVSAALGAGASAQTTALVQSATGVIGGIVTDDSGGAVPGASVHVTNEDTSVVVDADTDAQGAYRVDTLVPGRYWLEVALDGFETAVKRVTIDVGQAATVDVTLGPARFTEGVVVTAIDDYSLVNLRLGVRAASGWAVFLWSRNLLDTEYFELLSAAPGNTASMSGSRVTRDPSASRCR